GGPLVPDGDAVLPEPADVAVAAEEPEQLDGDRPEVPLLGGDQREALGQVVAESLAEQADRAGAGAVLLGRALLEDAPEEVLVLGVDRCAVHDPEGTGRGRRNGSALGDVGARGDLGAV